jgi:hypothetical protein
MTTQEALRPRNHAAIAKIAALLPVNANEADLKREAIGGAASEDGRALHVAERSRLMVADPDAGPLGAAVPGAAPVEVPAADVDQGIEDNVSEMRQILKVWLLGR